MFLIRRLTAQVVVGSLILATACSDPTSAGSDKDVLWEVDGEMSTAPVVVDSIVVTALVDGRLIARQRLTGRLLWQLPFSGAEFRSERLAHVGDIVIAPHFLLHGVDVRTGTRRWTFAGRDQSAGILSPTVTGDTVFVAGYTGGTAAALDGRTGTVLWQRDFPQTVYHPSVTSDLVIYPLRHDRLPNEVVALDRYTGEIRWRHQIPDSVGFPTGTNSGGAIMGDRTIVATSLGRVRALRLSDGALLWERGQGNPPASTAYVSQPLPMGELVLLLRSADGLLEGRSPITGDVQWSTPLGATLFNSPRPCGTQFCFSTGRVWIFDRLGKILWSDGGGSSAVFLSNVAVSSDGTMYAGVYFNQTRRAFIRAFRPPVQIGATP